MPTALSDVDHFIGNPSDPPVRQPPGTALIGLDPVPQFDRYPGCGDPADHGRGVQMLPPQSGVRGLPPAPCVAQFDHVGEQHMVVRAQIPCP
jgi:hypothetical protein